MRSALIGPRGLVAALTVVFLFVFASYNRGQPVHLSFGFGAVTIDAVFAIYLGACAGLLAMFLLGLPADLASRAERRRLSRRVEQLERESPDRTSGRLEGD